MVKRKGYILIIKDLKKKKEERDRACIFSFVLELNPLVPIKEIFIHVRKGRTLGDKKFRET